MDVLTIQAGKVELAFTGVCMTTKERKEWEHWNEIASLSTDLGAANPCEDCTVEFYGEMMAAGTCDGRPKGADVRRIRKGIATKWDDEEWAAKERARRSEAAKTRNRKGGRRKRKSKYAGQRCQHDPCRLQPVSTSTHTGKMLCRKHSNLESYHRTKDKHT
jgi:hypothetical protein